MRHEFDEDDDEPYIIVEKGSNGIGSFLLGAAIGAGVALLLAPRSGAATRRQIRRRARDVTSTVTETFHDARRRVEEQIDSAREAIEVKREEVHRAMQAGRAAADEARANLEHRIAETKAAYQAGAGVARARRSTEKT